MPPVLELRGLSKTYRQGSQSVPALRDVDLRVGEGEVVAIMGPSGSGKSTLLTLGGGLEHASSGQVLIDDVDLVSLDRSARARLRRTALGFVFQEFNLLVGLSAAENVAMPLELDGLRPRVARKQALQALDLVGIADKADAFPDDLSGGEQQRVAIARAVVGGRRLLLADEPTGALDSANGEAVMRLIRSVAATGTAVVLVTHDAHLAAWADRIVFLRDGMIVSETAADGPDVLLREAGTA